SPRATLSAMHAWPAGQRVSDYRGAATVLEALPDAETLIADKGYDSD
ncbi:MAG: IS5 family transposase, partial [Paracoccaceae bacterium]